MNTGFRSGEPVCLILAILEQSIQTLSHFLIYLCCTQVSLIPDLCLAGLCCSHGYRIESWTVPTLLLLLGKGSFCQLTSSALALPYATEQQTAQHLCVYNLVVVSVDREWTFPSSPEHAVQKCCHSYDLSQKRSWGGLAINWAWKHWTASEEMHPTSTLPPCLSHSFLFLTSLNSTF